MTEEPLQHKRWHTRCRPVGRRCVAQKVRGEWNTQFLAYLSEPSLKRRSVERAPHTRTEQSITGQFASIFIEVTIDYFDRLKSDSRVPLFPTLAIDQQCSLSQVNIVEFQIH